MADSIVLTATIDALVKTATMALTPAELSILKVSVAPAAADVEVVLGGQTNPKAIVVLGGDGITVRRVAITGTVLNANPFYAECNPTGFAQTSIFLSHSGSQPIVVTILSAE